MTYVEEIRQAVPVPAHIHACAAAVRYDLLHGPAWAAVPATGIEHFTADHFATFREDLAELEAEGCTVSEVYAGPVASALREFIDDLPTLYADEDGYVADSEPEGFWEDDPEDDGAPMWIDPVAYSRLSDADVTAALFGQTIAREFR